MSPDIGEKTFNKTAAPGDDVADDTGDDGDDATKTDRFLPCWILFLVRTKTIFQLLFFFFYAGKGESGGRDQHHVQLEHRLQILPRPLLRRLCQEGSA